MFMSEKNLGRNGSVYWPVMIYLFFHINFALAKYSKKGEEEMNAVKTK